MKKRIISIFLVFNCFFTCFAIPVVEKKYDSDYHTYYCSELFDSRKYEIITILDDCNYYVVAYDPQTCVRFIIQFREKSDGMNLIQQYKSITSSLGSSEPRYILDSCSYEISKLIRCYVQSYETDMDYISSGYIFRYATPLRKYKTMEEYDASLKKKNEEEEKTSSSSSSSSQYRPCSLF